MGAPAPEASPAIPGGGAVGGQSAQLVQQIESLLLQLAQSEPEPDIQQMVQKMSADAQALQAVVGKDDMADMSSGLQNPGGEAGGGLPPEPAGPPPTTFAGAKAGAKKAMESGSLPSETERTKNKKKG